ncbi:MAG: hypothetical protein BWY17_00765 [Deltaproteobacteria bacterium ADurb.Bin207]|nr:MAG: hypothetical protein BWY17_00765 [Deltaproteobacteria bacterium ADurb.Bin207]
MLRHPVSTVVFAVGLWVVSLWAMAASAQPAVDTAAKRLTDGSSFQVRVQAALALGASGSERAVGPLCGALDDETASVRAAAAAALARLRKPSGLSCLKARAGKETNGAVKTQIEKASARIEKDAEHQRNAKASRQPTRASRLYVAVEATKTKHGRRKGEIELLVQATIRRLLLADAKVALAPSGQSPQDFDNAAKGNRVQGYLLRPTVESVDYDGAKLSVALRVTLFSYPSMALQGEFFPKLSMSGTPQRDPEAEDELLQMAAQKAVEKFLATTR